MINLDTLVKDVWSESDLVTKKSKALLLINTSHAKQATKNKYVQELERLKTGSAVDQLVVNYSLSGAGLKVIK